MTHNNAKPVTLKPMADELCSEALNELVEDALTVAESRGATELVLDLSEVEILNSCCLGILIQMKLKLSTIPCGLSVTGCRKHIADLFRATRLDEYLGLDLQATNKSQVA